MTAVTAEVERINASVMKLMVTIGCVSNGRSVVIFEAIVSSVVKRILSNIFYLGEACDHCSSLLFHFFSVWCVCLDHCGAEVTSRLSLTLK